jgi:hypothetical protein
MRNAAVQKELIAAGKRSVSGHTEWIWGYDPTVAWDTTPRVPEIEAPEA